MDRKAALLIAAKDLFLEFRKNVPVLFKQPKDAKAPGKELDAYAEQFAAFHEKLRTSLKD